MPRQDYEPIYNGDRYCLMCRWACPVERVTRREATSPHGWALLIASQHRGLVAWNAETVDTLYQCADCGLCQANCATDRPLPYAIVAGRAEVVDKAALPPTVAALAVGLRRSGHPYGDAAATDFGPVQVTADAKVALFVGAATRFERPETLRAAIALLEAAGQRFRLVSLERSGVYLPYTLGLWDAAFLLGEQTIDEIAGADTVLTLSKEDAHAFKHIYPELGLTLPADVTVVEFASWLTDAIAAGRLEITADELPGAVYHDPCQSPRLPDSIDAGRGLAWALLGAAPGEMFWRGKAAAPCGAVGGFTFTQPQLATALARERLADCAARGGQTLITEDPVCSAQLARHAGAVPILNLIELAAARLRRPQTRAAH